MAVGQEFSGLWDIEEAPRLTPAAVEQQLSEFEQGLIEFWREPPDGSDILRSFAVAAATDFNSQKFPEFREVISGLIQNRPTAMRDYRIQLLWRALQKQLLKKDRQGQDLPQYPDAYRQPAPWQTAFQVIIKDPLSRHELEEDLHTKHIQTNEPQRYAGKKLAIRGHEEQLPDQPSLLDIGTSAGLGLVQLMKNIPFAEIRIAGPLVEEDPSIIPLFHRKFLGKLALGKVVGVDKVLIDPGSIEWIEACSYYPTELASEKRRQHRHRLYQHRPELDQRLIDITVADKQLEEIQKITPEGSYTVTSALTTYYAMTKRGERKRALQNQVKLTSHLQVVQDFADLSEDNPDELKFRVNVRGSNNLFVRYPRAAEPRWHLLGGFTNGRARTFIPAQAGVNLLRTGNVEGD